MKGPKDIADNILQSILHKSSDANFTGVSEIIYLKVGNTRSAVNIAKNCEDSCCKNFSAIGEMCS